MHRSRRAAFVGAVLAVCSLVSMAFGSGAAVAAGTTTASISATIGADGTASFDADNNPGDDSGPNNGIVRVNDTVTYSIQYAVNGDVGKNTTFTLTLPQGMEMTGVPAYCKTGSSLDPADAGSATLPYTATSFTQLKAQTLKCNLGDQENASQTVSVSAKVSNLVHNGATLTPTSLSITADGMSVPSLAADLPSVKATSRLKWDISKNGTATAADSGNVWGPRTVACPDPQGNTTRLCLYTVYPLEISAPAGGKGAMPAVDDVTFTDDVSPRKFFTGLTEAQYTALEANPTKYGVRVWPAGPYSVWSTPYGKIGGAVTAENSVRDSGTLSVDQPSLGGPAKFTIKNADWSLKTYPSKGSSGAALPTGRAYAVSQGVKVFVPLDAIRDFGTKNGNKWTLKTANTYTDLNMHGFDTTDVETSDGQDKTNDYRNVQNVIQTPGSFDKFFAGVPGSSSDTQADNDVWNHAWANESAALPGGTTVRSGNTTVAPGQQVVSYLLFGGANSTNPSEYSWVGCDTWDNTKTALTKMNIPQLDQTYQGIHRYSSNGQAVWVSGHMNAQQYVNPVSDLPNIKVQYATGATPANAADSDCNQQNVTWYDSPDAVPGNNAAQASKGIYTAVNRVRISFVQPTPKPVTEDQVFTSVSIGMTVTADGMPDGTTIPNWAESYGLTGNHPATDVLANPPTATKNDRLILAHAQARITKQVRKGTTGNFADSINVTGGDHVQYQIKPSLTSGAQSSGEKQKVWVEDCVPSQLSVDAANTTPAPTVTAPQSPADTQRPKCATGETYVRWEFNNQEINQPVPVITLAADVSQAAEDGTYPNTAYVWSDGDRSLISLRNDEADVVIQNKAGVLLDKRSLTPQVQLNRTDATKLESNQWELRMTNTLPAGGTPVTDPQIVDVLPNSGEHGSTFSGTVALQSVTITEGQTAKNGGGKATVEYTNSTNVPRDTSTPMPASVKWCTQDQIGTTAGCPETLDKTTAIRISRSGAFATGEAITADVTVNMKGDKSGDTVANEAYAKATGLKYPVGPVDRPQEVQGSSVGDYAWWDYNHDGIQDSNEPAASGVKVTLSGKDDLGNTVNLTTTTDANGKYSFADLRASDDAGYSVTFSKPDAYSFTKQAQGSDRAKDSDPDPSTGVAKVVLPKASEDASVDAGLIGSGALDLTKNLQGTGVKGVQDPRDTAFTVVCQAPGQTQGHVVSQMVTLRENIATGTMAAAPITGIPAGSTCFVREVAGGNATKMAVPVNVTIPNGTTVAARTAKVNMTNYYASGTVQVTKKLTGDAAAVKKAQSETFTFDLTCEIQDPTAKDPKILQSGTVQITGAGTKAFADANGKPYSFPAGTKCFAKETENGGAAKSTVEAFDFSHGVVIGSGPNATADGSKETVSTIQAVNEFKNPPVTPNPPTSSTPPASARPAPRSKLALTGTDIAIFVIAAIVLAGLGIGFVAIRRHGKSHDKHK